MAQVEYQRSTLHFVTSEAEGYRSRGTLSVDNSAGTDPIVAGTSVTEGIIAEEVPAGEIKTVTIMERDCEVNGNHITWPAPGNQAAIDTETARLLTLGIIVR